MAERFVICVDGIYVRDGKILLMKRNLEPFKGFWHVVGGHVNENENPMEALKREFKEETNLDIAIGEIVDARIEKTFDRTKIIIAFEVVSAEGDIMINSENEDYGWFTEFPVKSVYDYSRHIKRIDRKKSGSVHMKSAN